MSKRLINFTISLLIILYTIGCGAKGDLSTLRSERKPYLQKLVPINYHTIRNNIIDNRLKNGSTLIMFENSQQNFLTLSMQNNFSGEIGCFFDFKSQGESTLITVYDWVCAKEFIIDTINIAEGK